MANLFNVILKRVPIAAQQSVTVVLKEMLGPNAANKINQLLNNGGLAFNDLNEQAANNFSSKLRNAGATVSIELSNNTVELFRVRLLSFGEHKIRVIKQVRNITGLGLQESKALVERNGVVKENIDKEDATKIRDKLVKAGANVVIESMLVSDTGDNNKDEIEVPQTPAAPDFSNNTSYLVTGQVNLADEKPAKGVLVRAYDKDLRSEQLLGEASTLENGEYAIPYTQEQFSRSEKNNADLVLRVFNEVGVILALKTKVKDTQDIFFNSPKKSEINLQLAESANVAASEYQRLDALINPALDGLTVADLSLQDIDFLINETEIIEFADEFPDGTNSIHFIAQSAKLSSETGIATAAFYGWARMQLGLVSNEKTDQLTLDLASLLSKDDQRLSETLKHAVEADIIPARTAEQSDSVLEKLQRLRDEKAQEQRKLWTQHQAKGILLDAASSEPLDGYFVGTENLNQDNALNLEGSITNAQGEFIISYALPPESTTSTLSLALNIEAPRGEALETQQVNVSVDQVQPVTIMITVPVPVEPGEDVLLAALPMSFSSSLSAVLETNNLGNIAALRKVGDLTNLEGLPESLLGSNELKELQAHVDLSLLSTHLEPEKQIQQNQFLIDKKFNSYLDIADTTLERFTEALGSDVSNIIHPDLVYRNATQLVNVLDGRYIDYQTGTTKAKDGEDLPDPSLSCQCEDCVSAISPGAYLTDLIGYVTKKENVTQANGDAVTLDLLVKNFHQPLTKLPINCKATKTKVRQVRIACEVLFSSMKVPQLNFLITDEHIAKYRQKTYQSLLRSIGTSQFDLDRASSENEIESIANRLGIDPKYVEKLQLDSALHHLNENALSEHSLERIFGLPAFMEMHNDTGVPQARLRDPLRFLTADQKRPELYDWRLERIQKQWKDSDFPKSSLAKNTPIIDPDVIGPDDFRHPEDTNTAFQLWQTRREWLDVQVALIHGKVAAVVNKPNGLKEAISAISVSTTLDDLIAQQALLNDDEKLLSDEEKIIKDAAFVQWLTERHLSVDAFTELAKFAADIKAGTKYNDEKWASYTTTATNILVDSVKKSIYESWILEEGNISLNMTTFWPSLTEPKEGEWSLFLEDEKPLIDPEKIEPKYLPDDSFGLNASKLWDERRKALDTKQKEYVDILKSTSPNRLSDIMLIAFGSVPDIEATNTKLNSLAPAEQLAAKTEISLLNLDEDSFRSLVSARLILEDVNQVLSDTVQNNLIDALVTAHKLNVLYEAWVLKETGLPYWTLLKARLPKWRASQQQRQQWQQALKQASKPPLIDPDIISGDVLLEPVIGNFAFDTWRSRTKVIEAELEAIRDKIEQGGNVSIEGVIKPDAANDLFNDEKYLGISLEALIALSKLEEEGTSINSRLQQISLARDAYLFLLDVAKRIEKGSKVLSATRESVYSILLQIWKIKQFSAWAEEEKSELSLSPEFFKHPKQRRIFTTQKDAQKWRVDTRRQREWLRTLRGRIGQQETLASSLKTIVSDVEEQALPILRNALINIVDDSGNELSTKAEKLTKQFLIGMQMSGCQTTTRVSMALELLQILVFSIRSGELNIAGKKLALKSKSFEKEWKWMGSYATWKAAMGVFLYPEQILYPALRQDKTQMFRSIEESLKLDSTSKNICKLTTVCSEYIKDLVSLKPIVTCHATVNVGASDECSEQATRYKDLFFVFAQGEFSKNYYWSTMDLDNANESSQSYWQKMVLPEGFIIKNMIGAGTSTLVVSNSLLNKNNIFAFFEVYENKINIKKIVYATFDLNNNKWVGEGELIAFDSVELREENYNSAKLIQGSVDIFITTDKDTYVAKYNPIVNQWKHLRVSFPSRLIDRNHSTYGMFFHSAQFIYSSVGTSSYINLLVSSYYYDDSRPNSSGNIYENIQLSLKNGTYVEYDSTRLYIENLAITPVCSAVIRKGFSSSILMLFKDSNDLYKSSIVLNDELPPKVIKSNNRERLDELGKDLHFAIPNYRYNFDEVLLTGSHLTYGTKKKRAIYLAKISDELLINIGSTKLISLFDHFDSVPNILRSDRIENSKSLIRMIDRLHFGALDERLPFIGKYINYLKEAYFFFPLQIALTLHKKGQYKESLFWFRSIFDYQNVKGERKIASLLKIEGFSRASYERDDWIQDPLNPHFFQRNNKYNSFVLQNIIRCLLDYADSEFTFDTSESVAKAKSLYQTALDLIQAELPPQPTNKCLVLIEALKYTVKDTTLQPYYDYLKLKLGEFTSTDALKSTLQEVRNKLNDNGLEEDRLSKALAVIQVALGERKASLTAIEIMNKSLQTRLIFSQTLFSDINFFANFYNIDRLSLGLANSTGNNSAVIETLEIPDFNKIEIDYAPSLSYEFCIPNNPTAKFLLLRAMLNLFKIRNCMNIAGMKRELEPYAAPIDVESALPSMGAGGQINLAGVTRIRPTQYRYPVLVDRAKQLTNLAQQTETSFFNTLQLVGQEKYTLFKARQDVALSREGVKLQKLRVRESEDGVGLAELQLERTSILEETYADWSREYILDLEKSLYSEYRVLGSKQEDVNTARVLTNFMSMLVTASAGGFSAPVAAAAAFTAFGTAGVEAGMQNMVIKSQTTISELSLQISIALRNREYELQHQLAEQDLEVGNQQIRLANDRVHITEQEQAIAEIQSEQAADTVIFLQEKFPNVELYDWMSGVLQDIFRYFLQQASSMSKLAEIQLAFERQEPLLGVIKDDYYELPNDDGNDSASGDSSNVDRRGLTGSARLLRDITTLDQHAFLTDQRKQQLSVNFSLSQLDPFAFQQFKQTGVLNFDTSGKLFDRRFPGQYLRLIKRVRVSVIALVPPVQGISATLTASGISRAVIKGDVFQTTVIRRDPESIAFTNPVGASGVFELNPNPEMLLPFEGNGVDTRWEFRLPKAANPMDFSSIADVLLTIEYTALHDRAYQEQVQRELDTFTSFDRAFSLRQQFSDAWYDLHNPEQTDTPMSVSFETSLADFPSNLQDINISHILMYIVTDNDLPSVFDVTLTFNNDGNPKGGIAKPIDSVMSTRRNASNWTNIKGIPEGKWQLGLPNTSVIKQLFEDEKISDILLVLTCDGELPSVYF